MRRMIPILVMLGAVLAPSVALWLAAANLPELAVRSHRRSTDNGRLLIRYPVGQRFRCEHDGLSRIEVALVPRAYPLRGRLELVLYEDPVPEGSKGSPLRRVSIDVPPLERRGEFVPFEFEPVPDSAGRSYRFWLLPGGGVQPGTVSAWVRYHGREGSIVRWGAQTLQGPLIEGSLLSPARDLRALAVAFRAVAPRLGEVRLELWLDEPEGPPLRVATLAPEDETYRGWAFFPFEPIPDSLHRMIHYRLHLPEHALVGGGPQGPAVSTLHGSDEPGEGPLLGMLRGAREYHDRDLFVRVYTQRPPLAEAAALLRSRPLTFVSAATLWLGAVALVLSALGRAMGHSPGEGGGGKTEREAEIPPVVD